MKVSAQKIKSELNKVEYHQSLQRAHEARDRAIMAANLDRVTFWSVVNAAVLILVACVQVSNTGYMGYLKLSGGPGY